MAKAATATAAKPKSASTAKLEKEIKFEFYAPLAKNVKLAGDFNKWNPSKTVLEKKGDGRWTTTMTLKAGRYEYRYQVDGNWENDQRQVKLVPNSFGSWNCVLEVQ